MPNIRADPDRHVRIAGEVEIQLDREGDDADDRCRGTEIAGGRRECRVGDRRDRVGDQDLLAEAVSEAIDAGGEHGGGLGPPHELVADLVEPDDRSGDELREERDVQREVQSGSTRWRAVPRKTSIR